MARQGMDVEAVEQKARELKNHAVAIGNLIAQLDQAVASLPSVWEGADAQQFVNDWWPEHKRALQAAQSAVDGLGQSAINNAAAQREVSSR